MSTETNPRGMIGPAQPSPFAKFAAVFFLGSITLSLGMCTVSVFSGGDDNAKASYSGSGQMQLVSDREVPWHTCVGAIKSGGWTITSQNDTYVMARRGKYQQTCSKVGNRLVISKYN